MFLLAKHPLLLLPTAPQSPSKESPLLHSPGGLAWAWGGHITRPAP